MTLDVPYPTRLVLAAAFLLANALAAQSQQPAPATTTAAPVFANGMAQLVPAFQDSSRWIRQNLWVETDFDSDRDGRKDRVHVDVTRPAQTETEGLRVPVIYGSSPYFAGTARGLAMWDVKQELGAESPPRGPMASPPYRADRTRISNALVNNWVPRGFAVVHSEASGTGRSQGCPTVGDHPERMAMKFVIDWLTGRARGFTTPTGPDEVKATSWSTGRVGMMGTSYEGTLPVAAATTGVKGLEVVIPVAPNTSYYHYYRANGLVRSPGGYLGEDVDVLYDFVASGDTAGRPNCDRLWKNGVFAGAKGQDRATGDFNDFWEARDLLPHVKNIKAAVLLAHGLNDYNVTPSHSVRIYEEMRARGLPASIYLHQGGHGGSPPADMVNRWFSHYLYGVANGVETDPPAWIVPRAGTPTAPPAPFASFPVPGSVPVVLHPMSGGAGIAGLSLTPPAEGADTLVDDVAMSGSANASAARSSNRLLYATATLTDTVHISGTARVTLRVASSKPAANLSVWLVTLPYDSARLGSQGHAGVVTRGWADIQNYKSLTNGGNYASKRAGEALVPGKFYDLTFDLEPDDQMIPAGQQLAVMIMSSDREFTLWPQAGTRLTVDLARSSFALPVVGGVTALQKAAAFTQSATDQRFDALASLAEAKMKEFGVPGLALGIVRDGVVSIRGLGVTNLEDPLPVTAHTVFPIASISKTFAATAMMRLVEQGKVDLRAPVRTYLPDFRVRDTAVSRDVTVWHLLTHLGGWEGQVSGPDRGTETLKNFVGSITDLMQVAPPGAAWSYNNAGFSIAGHVIEAVTGTSINRAIRDLVFQPLGLEHAGTTAGDFIVQRFASGHSTRNGVAMLMRPFAPSVSVTAGGVGLCMTDLLAYARFHMGDGTAANGERVLKRESLERLRTPQQRKQSNDDDMGIGWHLRSVGAIRTASHGGTLGGHILLLEIVPERNFAIAILTNSSVGWRVIQDVEREALKSYLGATYAPNQAIAHRGLVETLPSVQPLARQPDLAPYVGTYARPSNTVAVRADGARLLVQNRPNNGQPGAEMPISFFGPDRAVVTEGPDTGQSIEFVRDSSGRVSWIRVVGRVAVRTP